MAKIIEQFTTFNILRLTTGLAVVDGIICIVMLLLIPSDQKSIWLFGYSRSRILLLVVCVIGISIFVGLFFWLFLRSEQAIHMCRKLETILLTERLSTAIIFFIVSLFLLSLFYLVFTYTNLDYHVPSDAITAMEQVKAYMYRLAPFALWSALLCGQMLIALTFLGYASTEKYLRTVQVLSIIIWPLFLVIIWGVNKIDPYYYVTLAKEDNLIEWMSVFFFVLTGALTFFLAIRHGNQSRWFYMFFSLACFLFALEEISWGQRIFGLESTQFFVENSDQQELNVHNVINEWFSIRTKHVAALVLFLYGAVFPIVALNRHIKLIAIRLGVLIPPLILVPGFVLASILTIDKLFSGREEEVAELFFSLLLFLTIAFQFLDPSEGNYRKIPKNPKHQLLNQQ